MGTLESQYVDWDMSFRATNVDDPDYTILIKLNLSDSSSERQVQAFKDIVEEVQDEDEVTAMVGKVLQNMINSMQPAHTQQNLDENERIVTTWKRFLRG
jgi:hypothetical protein